MGAAWRRLKKPFLINVTPFLGPSPLGALVGRSAGEFRLLYRRPKKKELLIGITPFLAQALLVLWWDAQLGGALGGISDLVP